MAGMENSPNNSRWRSWLIAINFVCLGAGTIWFMVALIIALTTSERRVAADLPIMGLVLIALWIERAF
jgi:hypothetical protein